MELQPVWFIIPLILLGGIIYSVVRGYIKGCVLACISILTSLCNLLYYIAGFFLQCPGNYLPYPAVIPFLGFSFIVWLLIGGICASRQWPLRPSVSICLLVNVFLILTWNLLVYTSYFL
ncbi:hypothetical protein DW886_06185 [Enterocloster aldenensis]|uniref:hypothetical protein n=1 Tax=Enterocloster aldenensis TaxID=358742 RepID=UPI000E4C25E8|nr:hypothetical protein DW886_06185 [Enterocloster aldenensis]